MKACAVLSLLPAALLGNVGCRHTSLSFMYNQLLTSLWHPPMTGGPPGKLGCTKWSSMPSSVTYKESCPLLLCTLQTQRLAGCLHCSLQHLTTLSRGQSAPVICKEGLGGG